MNEWEVEMLAATLLQLGVESESSRAAHYRPFLDAGTDLISERLSEASNRVMIFFYYN